MSWSILKSKNGVLSVAPSISVAAKGEHEARRYVETDEERAQALCSYLNGGLHPDITQKILEEIEVNQ